MKHLNQLLFIFTFLLTSVVFGQKNKIVDFPAEQRINYEFKGNWTIKQLQNPNEFEIFGEQLSNDTKTVSTKLKIETYFVPLATDVSLKDMANKLPEPILINGIPAHTSFKNIRIKFNRKEISHLDNGIYNVILVLKDQVSGSVKNYNVLDFPIEINNDKIIIYKNGLPAVSEKVVVSDPVVVATAVPVNAEVVEVTAEAPRRAVVNAVEGLDKYVAPLNDSKVYDASQIILSRNAGPVDLSGMWKLDVDFKTGDIVISGVNNSVNNKNSTISNDLKLIVYFSLQEPVPYKLIEGYEITSIDLGRFKPSTTMQNATIEANITRMIPGGTYYASLILLEKNSEGSYDIVSNISFADKFVL